MKTAAAFFWGDRDGNPYCVLILDENHREWRLKDGSWRHQIYCREYQAKTVRDLRKRAARGHWKLPRNVVALCRQSPRWKYWRVRG